MAQDATAVNDAPITDATDSAPVETSETTENLDSFDLDDSDFKASESTDEEGEASDDTKSEPDEGVEEVDKPDTAEDTEATDTDTADEPADKPSKEDKRQDFIRNLVNERNELRRQIAEQNAKVYESRTPEQLQAEVNPDTGEYYTALEARVIAAEERQALREYNDQVADAQLAIQTDAANVLKDFPIFDESNKETFNKDIAVAADQLLADNFIRDPNTEQKDANGNPIPGTGQIIGQHLPTYQLYKLINDAVNIGKTNGVLEGQKATKKMLATADTPTSGGPKDNKKDAGVDAFEKELDRF